MATNSATQSPPGVAPAPTGISVTPGPDPSYSFTANWTPGAGYYTHDWVAIYRSGVTLAQFYVPYHGTGPYSRTFNLIQPDVEGAPGGASYWVEVYSCNTTHNPWFGGCTYGAGSYVSLSAP